jgi:hypothetical protein
MSSEVETSLIVVLRRLLRLILKSDLWISGFFSSSFYFVPSELFPVVQRIERRLSFERVLMSFVHEHRARSKRQSVLFPHLNATNCYIIFPVCFRNSPEIQSGNASSTSKCPSHNTFLALLQERCSQNILGGEQRCKISGVRSIPPPRA